MPQTSGAGALIFAVVRLRGLKLMKQKGPRCGGSGTVSMAWLLKGPSDQEDPTVVRLCVCAQCYFSCNTSKGPAVVGVVLPKRTPAW